MIFKQIKLLDFLSHKICCSINFVNSKPTKHIDKIDSQLENEELLRVVLW